MAGSGPVCLRTRHVYKHPKGRTHPWGALGTPLQPVVPGSQHSRAQAARNLQKSAHMATFDENSLFCDPYWERRSHPVQFTLFWQNWPNYPLYRL